MPTENQLDKQPQPILKIGDLQIYKADELLYIFHPNTGHYTGIDPQNGVCSCEGTHSKHDDFFARLQCEIKFH